MLKNWFFIFFATFAFFSIAVASVIIAVDPYFHYHKPLKSLFYVIDNQRSQNDGITKRFDYDALITGTSMTENFKSTEVDAIFDVKSIKVPYSGGSFKEINDDLKIALKKKSPKIIIRSLDATMFDMDKDAMRTDLGKYPTHLYNENPFDDVLYIFNKQILFNICIPMLERHMKKNVGGITDFDHYSYWMPYFKFGKEEVLKDIESFSDAKKTNSLSDAEKKMIFQNIEQNVVSLAKNNPQCTFYYFLPPYSAAWWGQLRQKGDFERQIETEKLVIKQILECKNIHLFSFDGDFEMTTDLNNYKDAIHYGEWVNSLMLRKMKNGENRLNKENYISHLEKIRSFYAGFDFNSLFEQIDEEDRPLDLN